MASPMNCVVGSNCGGRRRANGNATKTTWTLKNPNSLSLWATSIIFAILLFLTQSPSTTSVESQLPQTTSTPTTTSTTTTSTSTSTSTSTTTTTTTTTTAAPITTSTASSQPPPTTPTSAGRAATTTPTTTSAPTSSTTTTTTTTPKPGVNEVKKAIQEHLTAAVETRFAMNKPTLAPQTSDFAADSMEVKVADATTQFGLNFIKSLELGSHENLLISPLSLQNLLNMILLGADDQSQTEAELIKALGYEETDLLSAKSGAPNSTKDRLRPHEAMHNLLDSITRATHLIIGPPGDSPAGLLNTNPAALPPPAATDQANNANHTAGRLAAHLQTATRDNEPALSGQVNFTLANLLLTDESLKLSDEFEKNLKQFYNVKVESFSRQRHHNNTSQKDNNSSSNNNNKTATTSPVVVDEAPLHERVNRWVRNVTQNQIDQLASESDLSGDDLLMVLLNAAHFKGRWQYTFNPKATYERVFFNDGHEKQAAEVKFMRQKATFGYADFGQSSEWAAASGAGAGDATGGGSRTTSSDDAETLLTEDAVKMGSNSTPAGNNNNNNNNYRQEAPTIELSKEESRRLELTSKLNCSVLMLPFSLNDGQELSMVILLPAKRDGLAELLASLSWPALNEIYRSLSEQQVQVELPKFAFETAHDAKSALKRMGLSGMFSEAQLERMFAPASNSSSPALQQVPKKVGKVIHKAKISVDEAGAEAAASSMATIVLRNFIRPPSPVFVADHPFLFIIRHNRSNMPLFMGRVSSLT